MASMAAVFNGVLQFPPFEGQPNCKVPFDGSWDFTKKFEAEYELVGAGAQAVSLTHLGVDGAKFVAVFYKNSSAVSPAVITVVINGGADAEQLAKGGFKVHYNPVPSAAGGILSLTINHTAAAEVSVWAFA